ncbi:MAG: IS110 family transposase [Solirubrobacterales bacterium]|nr:IS110 family transposase [Solirubrobacterales bacterium]
MLGQSVLPDDKVILESTGNALEIARVLEPFVSEVVIANPMYVRAISHAKVKNDQFDARTLAELLAADLVPRVWIGDERTRVLRRLTSRRIQLVRQRTRPKNEISAVLVRNLKGRSPMSDLFGKRGRQWLAELQLPDDERDTVEACLRQIDFLTAEIAHVDCRLAEQALQSPEIKRLMTIPGIDVTTAATLIAAIGDIHRFPSAKKLVGYLGIDPRVRQSGQSHARQGRISKQGSSNCRHVLGEAAWSAVKTPGPLRAFYQRVRARRGAQVAITATARKLACLCGQLLTTEQDYAFKRQTTVDRKLRALELRAGAPTRHGTQQTKGTPTIKQRTLQERQLTEQAELAYQRLIQDWQATATSRNGAGAAPGRASQRPSSGTAARQGTAPEPAL